MPPILVSQLEFMKRRGGNIKRAIYRVIQALVFTASNFANRSNRTQKLRSWFINNFPRAYGILLRAAGQTDLAKVRNSDSLGHTVSQVRFLAVLKSNREVDL